MSISPSLYLKLQCGVCLMQKRQEWRGNLHLGSTFLPISHSTQLSFHFSYDLRLQATAYSILIPPIQNQQPMQAFAPLQPHQAHPSLYLIRNSISPSPTIPILNPQNLHPLAPNLPLPKHLPQPLPLSRSPRHCLPNNCPPSFPNHLF